MQMVSLSFVLSLSPTTRLSIHKIRTTFVSLSLKCLVSCPTQNSSPLQSAKYSTMASIILRYDIQFFRYPPSWPIGVQNGQLHEHTCISRNLSACSRTQSQMETSTTESFTQCFSWCISISSILIMLPRADISRDCNPCLIIDNVKSLRNEH